MYAISLTSIPPRFHRLGPVLNSLLAQDPSPSRVYLCLPRAYRRFPGAFDRPALPQGVDILWSETDHGPATKALPAARHLAGRVNTLIYCDDDWRMGPHWAAHLLDVKSHTIAAAATGFSVERLGRISSTGRGCADIAQGFSGVAIDPSWLSGPGLDPPEDARMVDDIWLSGHLARQEIGIELAPEARSALHLAYTDDHALQDMTGDGLSRDQVNRACADLIWNRYGIWPPKA